MMRARAHLGSLLAALAAGLPVGALADTELKAIEVEAALDAVAEQRYAAGQKVVFDREDIASLGGLSVSEVLRKLPGLERGADGMEGASASARGMARDSVLILVNGERPTASGRHALTVVGRLPAGELERVELMRGGSAEFGVTAEVVVNLVVRAPQAKPSRSLKATVGLRGDEPNLQLTGSVEGGVAERAWTLPLTFNRHRMPVEQQRMRGDPAGVVADERTLGRYRVDELILSPRLSLKDGERRLTVWPSLYLNNGWRRQQLSAGGVDTRVDRERSDMRIARLRADASMPLASVDGRLGLRLAVMDGDRRTDTRRLTAVGTAAVEALERSERELTGSARLDRAVGAHLLTWALEGAVLSRKDAQEAGSDTALALRRHDLRETSAAAWFQDEWTFGGADGDTFTLTSGLRVDGLRQRSGGGQRHTEAVSPSLALRWAFAPAWVLRTSVGSGLRAPKLDELSPVVTRSAGVNTPLEPDLGGRPGLAAERIQRFEIGVERYLGGERSVLGANAYFRRTADFIERTLADEAGRWVERPANVGDARHWGVELSVRLDSAALAGILPAGGSLRATLTLPRAEVDDARLGVRRIANDTPRHVSSLGYEHAPSGAALRYGVQLRHTGPVRTARASELQGTNRSGTRIDVHVTRQLAPGVDLRLAGENLLGARDRHARVARDDDRRWQLAGRDGGDRTWLLTLEGKW